ncbi:MAG: hypothetical protein KDA36_07815 [Planctomycetaceae bacterium]|nr:hypothetical protein [Planctomycetaceae bacterium]MCA9098275.1 hypothetical protein [Planctomycetaceae bacterium]
MSSDTIDRIVAGVLKKLSVPTVREEAPSAVPSPMGTRLPETNAVVLEAKVVTADVLEALAAGSEVVVHPKAIITPAAKDAVRERRITVTRQERPPGKSAGTDKAAVGEKTRSSLLIVIQNTDAFERIWNEIQGDWRRELLGCPDDAAKLAIGEISRGGVSSVLIACEQTYRAACLANRHSAVKAVPIRDVGDIKMARRQLRANVWCLPPTGRSYFELRNLVREIRNQ